MDERVRAVHQAFLNDPLTAAQGVIDAIDLLQTLQEMCESNSWAWGGQSQELSLSSRADAVRSELARLFR